MDQSNSKKKDFGGLRVLALESRRGVEIAKLIENCGGRAVVAPSMREVPLETNTAGQEFARRLIAGGFDMVIFLTGAGARALSRVAETVCTAEEFLAALRKVAVVARGPKPVSVLREWNVPFAVTAPEPNTWRELLRALDENSARVPLMGRRVAVQEYGASNPELLAGLRDRGAEVISIPVYEWALPEDLGPLRAAVREIAGGKIDAILFTTATQADHLLQIAREMGEEDALKQAATHLLVASIGPTTSQRLRELGISPDFEPSHPKMGVLVAEAAARCEEILQRKRTPQ